MPREMPFVGGDDESLSEPHRPDAVMIRPNQWRSDVDIRDPLLSVRIREKGFLFTRIEIEVFPRADREAGQTAVRRAGESVFVDSGRKCPYLLFRLSGERAESDCGLVLAASSLPWHSGWCAPGTVSIESVAVKWTGDAVRESLRISHRGEEIALAQHSWRDSERKRKIEWTTHYTCQPDDLRIRLLVLLAPWFMERLSDRNAG